MPAAREKRRRKMNILGVVLPWVVLIVGLVLLIKGADWFVDGASGLAKRMGVSPLVIGLTIVAFGTSAPEAAVSITSALKGSGGISLGNVVGSNLFNLLVVVGGCAIIKPTTIDKSIIKKDFPYSILATIVLLCGMFDAIMGDGAAMISRSDGLMVLAFFLIFMYYTVTSAIGEKPEENENEEKVALPKLIIMLIIGLAAIIGGGQMVVNGASDVARSFGVSETLIGLTIVAVGTSLPELVTSLVAIKKGEDNIAIGNVVGSNIFNVLFIVGIGSAIRSIAVDSVIITDTLMLLVINTLFYVYIARKKSVSRNAGIVMVVAYIAYMMYAILR